jgi:hypothetical protein
MKRLATTALALLLAACGSTTHPVASTVTPPPAAPKTLIGALGAPWQVIDNDGTYLVWVDILPGEYRNAGGTMCYWARLRSPDTSDIIDSKKTSGPQVIRIQGSDTAFLTQNCGTWQQIS